MTAIPSGIAAQQSLLRQNVALETVKAAAEQDQAIAGILDQSIQATAPVSESRGTNVNLLV